MTAQKNKSAENKVKQLEMEVSLLRDAYFQLEKTKKDLIKSEANYRDIFNKSPEGMILLNKMGRVTDVNQKLLDWLEYERDDVVNKNILTVPILDRKNKREAVKRLSERFAGKDIPPFELELRAKSGQIKIGRVTGALIKVQTREGLLDLVMISDITLEKEAQEKVKELSELRNKFIKIVSHQLRTPLGSIKWDLEVLLKGDMGKLTKSQVEFLRLVYEADVEVIRRLNELLAVIDIEEGKVTLDTKKTSLEKLWTSLQVEVKKKCEVKQIKFSFQKPEKPLPSIGVDPAKIRAVFDTLTRNAIDYTKKKGKVSAKLELVDGRVRFEVADSGVGIPKAEQSKIFSKFFRAGNAFTMVTDASGVGLSIAKYYMEQHGGQIGFESVEGKGSTFWFELPIKKKA